MGKKTILIIGLRRKCYEAANRLGYNVLLWNDGPLPEGRKKHLFDWIEEPYSSCRTGLSDKVKSLLKKHEIYRVIANTEETVILGAQSRQFLGLKTLAVDVTQRFHNKFVMKESAKKAGIPITRYHLIGEKSSATSLSEELGLPLVIKPVDDSGAQDVKICRSLDEVNDHMKVGLLAEAFVTGSELSVETFIKNGKSIFHNITGYLHQWRKSVVPAVLEPKLSRKILELNDKVIEHFGVDRGMTHAEFYLSNSGPIFGEIAIRPPGGYYMDLIQRVYNFDSWELYVKLCCDEEVEARDFTPTGCAAVVIFHPDSGNLKSVSGENEVRSKLKNIFDFKIRSKVGDFIPPHVNTSNELGHILFWEEDVETLYRSLDYIESTINFEVLPTTV